jgi:hypothetical protein
MKSQQTDRCESEREGDSVRSGSAAGCEAGLAPPSNGTIEEGYALGSGYAELQESKLRAGLRSK